MHEYMLAHNNPSVAPYAKDGEVQVRVTASARTKEEADADDPTGGGGNLPRLRKYLYGVDVALCRTLWSGSCGQKG